MNDRELLEMAAKAAGLDMNQLFYACGNCEAQEQWNPLTDDGDALRLAVKLGIRILHTSHESTTGYPNAVRAGTFEYGEAEEMHGDHEDCFAAVRRAIVRAASRIGRDMQ